MTADTPHQQPRPSRRPLESLPQPPMRVQKLKPSNQLQVSKKKLSPQKPAPQQADSHCRSRNSSAVYHGDYRTLNVYKESTSRSLQYGNFIERVDEEKIGPHMVLFTDGSRKGKDNRCAFAVTYKHSHSKKNDWNDIARGLWGVECNNRAEYAGIGMALAIALSNVLDVKMFASGNERPLPSIYVLTDSKTSLDLIETHAVRSYTEPTTASDRFLDLVLGPLYKLVQLGAHVNISWIKGHSTSGGNIRADSLASKAVDHMLRISRGPALEDEGFEIMFLPPMLKSDIDSVMLAAKLEAGYRKRVRDSKDDGVDEKPAKRQRID
ncbi:ribonuclease H-like domain-containing protein [Xylariomycetidae sp. FL2044]|nr:ribonuclease H-like domain-containing protein [Xylariomycetidae sp. FL2044]